MKCAVRRHGKRFDLIPFSRRTPLAGQYSERGVGHVYIPDHDVKMAFLGSGTPGDWALDEFWGPVATETRSWLDHLATGRPCVLATPAEARRTLQTTLAMEESLRTGAPVRIQ